MRRYINGDLSICILARDAEPTSGHLGKRKRNEIKKSDEIEQQPSAKRRKVEDLSTEQRSQAWKVGEPIRNMKNGKISSVEQNTPSLFSEEEQNLKASEVKKIEEQTKGMSSEEKAEFLQNEVDSRIGNLIKALEERDKRGDLDGVKPLGKDSILYGGAGEPDKQPDAGNPQAEAKGKENGSSGNPQDPTSVMDFPQEQNNISPDALAAIRLRRAVRADKLEREKDVNNVMGAIFAHTSLDITKEFAKMPTQMVIGLLLEFQKNARANSESGMSWAVGIAIVVLVEKAISLPFNQAIKKAQEAERKFGEKYEAQEFLKMLPQEGKNSNKGKTSPKYQRGKDYTETRNTQRYRDVLAFDPDKQGEVGAGAVIGESGNFYTGNQNPSSSRGTGGRDDY